MSGQSVATPVRRTKFIEYLREVGPGAACISWPWGLVREDGYFRPRINGEKIMAHRWVYEQINGPLERSHRSGAVGSIVMHECDNRACVRPSHLRLGTQSDNVIDAAVKGRLPLKVSEDGVQEIRRLASQGVYQKEIAAMFGVSQSGVSLIVNRRIRALPEAAQGAR